MLTHQLSCPRKIALALVCICFCLFASACQSTGKPLVNNTQGMSTTNGTDQTGNRNHSTVVQVPSPDGSNTQPQVQKNGGTRAPYPTSPTTASNTASPFYFAMGSEASGALKTPLVQQSPVKMLTSWYNGHNDLSWITSWHSSFIPSLYAKGYVLQLVVWSGDPEVNLNTRYGPACGRAYPVSSQFLRDMVPLAKTFQGTGSLYVSLFAEFSTYTCQDNQWIGNENYYRALKDQYRAALSIFHTYAPNARVSICWGGWIGRYDDPKVIGGRSFINKFSDIMSISDFQSFQSMETDSNVDDVQNMTSILHQWGRVLLAYYATSPATFNTDVHAMFTNAYMAKVIANGLFGFGFMTNQNSSASNSPFTFVKNAVMNYARS